ncbi:MAG TPA: type II toxin-antitoxin system VapC family toxin [Prolixibacteraceae bacterium]|nr:type II toxin-antitoxin system VapC family toxin [Prolixibacteraceae bacterium]HPS12586.1 type II toxin-antitoxin system VapC family toxin [Prolixibacteraceae bacterium]
MADKKYLIDTNIAIDYLGEKLPENGLTFMDDIIDKGYCISIINKIELFSYSKLTNDDISALTIFVDNSSVLNIGNEIVDKTIDVRKTHSIKLPDAIIAATAIVNDLVLITRNTKDFKNVQNLNLVDLYSL